HALRQERQGHLPRQAVRRQGRRTVGPGARRGHQGGAQGAVTAAMKSALARYAPLLILAAAWEILARLRPSDALPPPSGVIEAWYALVKTGELIVAAESSLYRGGVGLLLAIVVGAVIGIAIAWWRPANALIGPLVEMFYPMPKSA